MPSEDFDSSGKSVTDAGVAHVYFGAEGGINATESFRLFADGSSSSENFGAAIVAGNLNGDASIDLAVGMPGDSVSGLAGAGSVSVYYGPPGGFLAGANSFQLWTLNSTGVTGTAVQGDAFGSALTAWNFGGTPQADLAVGIPRADIGTILDAGSISVLYGSPTGISGTGSQIWNQNSTGIPDAAEANDRFGSSAY